MNEAIKFIADSKYGSYAADDTGALVGFSRSYTDELVAIVRTTDKTYVAAPLADIEYNGD